MAAGQQYPVSLIVKAVDNLTGPLAKMTAKLKAFSAPFDKLGKGFGGLLKASGIPRLSDAFGGAAGAVRNVGSEILGLAARFAALAAVGGFALFNLTKSAVESGDELFTMSKRVGLSVDAYASLQYAARQAHVSQEEFTTGIQKFSKNLGDAKARSGELYGFLEKVGPAWAEKFKQSKTVEEGLAIITDAMSRLTDESKRADLATKAFGRGGYAWADFLHTGGPAIQKAQLEFLRLAGSQKEFAENSEKVANAGRIFDTVFTGLRNRALVPFLPIFAQLTTSVSTFLLKNQDGIVKWATDGADAINGWVNGGGLGRLVQGLRDLGTQLSKGWEFIGGFKGAAVGLGAYFAGPLIGSVVGLIPAFAELGIALLATPVGLLTLGVAALSLAFADLYLNKDPANSFFGDLRGDIEATMTALQPLLEAVKGVYDFWKMAKADLKVWQDEAKGPNASFESRFISTLSDAASPLKSPILNPIGAIGNQVSKLKVVFGNAPAGTRVTVDDSPNMSIDTSVGYSMATP